MMMKIPNGVVVKGVAQYSVERFTHSRNIAGQRHKDEEWKVTEPWGTTNKESKCPPKPPPFPHL